jgi:uncharacterized metal-binding protein YceD (DUF177 family)
MSSITLSINIETVTAKSQHFHLIATLQEKEEMAIRLNLLSVDRLEAELHLKKKERFFLTGIIVADVTQQCVRTLIPFSQHLEIDVEEIFFPATDEAKDDIDIDLLEEVEPIHGNILDVGEVVIQLLSLSLDPYPVAPTTTPIDYHEDKESSSPFNILKKKE